MSGGSQLGHSASQHADEPRWDPSSVRILRLYPAGHPGLELEPTCPLGMWRQTGLCLCRALCQQNSLRQLKGSQGLLDAAPGEVHSQPHVLLLSPPSRCPGGSSRKTCTRPLLEHLATVPQLPCSASKHKPVQLGKRHPSSLVLPLVLLTKATLPFIPSCSGGTTP